MNSKRKCQSAFIVLLMDVIILFTMQTVGHADEIGSGSAKSSDRGAACSSAIGNAKAECTLTGNFKIKEVKCDCTRNTAGAGTFRYNEYQCTALVACTK